MWSKESDSNEDMATSESFFPSDMSRLSLDDDILREDEEETSVKYLVGFNSSSAEKEKKIGLRISQQIGKKCEKS